MKLPVYDKWYWDDVLKWLTYKGIKKDLTIHCVLGEKHEITLLYHYGTDSAYEWRRVVKTLDDILPYIEIDQEDFKRLYLINKLKKM